VAVSDVIKTFIPERTAEAEAVKAGNEVRLRQPSQDNADGNLGPKMSIHEKSASAVKTNK